MSMGDAFQVLKSMELTESEVAAVLARDERSSRVRLRTLVLTLSFVVAVVAAVAIPVGRANVADAILAAFHGGDLPGAAVSPTDTPPWYRQVEAQGGSAPRVIAETGGDRMLVFRQASGALCFDFGGIGVCAPDENSLFTPQPIALFGPTESQTAGRFVLWGLTLTTVEHVELRFVATPPVRVDSDGAFGISLHASDQPTTLIAYDAEGRIVKQIPVAARWARRPAL